ncbi:MAG: oxidoreductase, partial [Nonomuraea sp.]|nr:oxidoreductase [Nonomuraea sp.]
MMKALLVMEERRRADVYPDLVMERLAGLVEWLAPAMTRERLAADPGVLAEV